MPDDQILTDEQIERLHKLGRRIMSNLTCHTTCLHCQLNAVNSMKEYLEIHGYTVTKKEAIPCKRKTGPEEYPSPTP